MAELFELVHSMPYVVRVREIVLTRENERTGDNSDSSLRSNGCVLWIVAACGPGFPTYGMLWPSFLSWSIACHMSLGLGR